MTPTLRAAAGSDIGRRRTANQDSAYVSPRLLVVADGMGGHAHGEVASAVAVEELAELDDALGDDLTDTDLPDTLCTALDAAARRLSELAAADGSLRGTGTTVVALLADGTRIGVAHVGDSRAYLLRDGELHRLTRDHTLVQDLLDEGHISAEEAADHPRRSVLVRTLQEGVEPEPDLFVHEGRVGDRYLVCSDGVTAVVPDDDLYVELEAAADPAEAVERLIARANESGGPDNITCIVADLVDAPADEVEPVVLGAAAQR